eukprot:482983-Heterocapsa_arctica.AAC.1
MAAGKLKYRSLNLLGNQLRRTDRLERNGPMTRQECKTWSCEHRTGAGHAKCGDKRTSGQLELVNQEHMSNDPMIRLMTCLDINYQAANKGDIGHRQH